MYKRSIDSYDKAKYFLEKPLRIKPIRNDSSRVVEFIDLEQSSSSENGKEENPQAGLVGESVLKIKKERIDVLENAIRALSDRIGTEIIDDSDEDHGANSIKVTRYENNVNTLHYQLDDEFGEKFYFITNVIKIMNSIFISL